MRCPKCGFISFDQLPKCVKCGKDYSGIAQLLHGTAFSVTAPLFLKIQDVDETKAYGEEIRINAEVVEDFEVQDPDLEILFDDQETVAGADRSSLQMEADDDAGLRDGEDLLHETGKDEEGEIAIDLSQFQNDLAAPVVGGAVAALGSQSRIGRELPEGLADISDLAAPARKAVSPATEQAVDDFDFSLDLDMDDLEDGPTLAGSTSNVAQTLAKQADDDFDFNLDLGGEELKDRPDLPERQAPPAGDIDLDGFDLPSSGKPKGSGRKGAADESDLDLDLDFELNLGGLTLDKD
jgi:hypothetical protein